MSVGVATDQKQTNFEFGLNYTILSNYIFKF